MQFKKYQVQAYCRRNDSTSSRTRASEQRPTKLPDKLKMHITPGFKAFTLIELLLVLAIVFILLSMILPALRSARELTFRISCLNQMKQIGTAGLVYSTDADDRLPCAGTYDYINKENVSDETYTCTLSLYDYRYPGIPYYGHPQSHYAGIGKLYKCGYLGDYRIFWCPRPYQSKFNYKDSYYGWNDYIWLGYIYRVGAFSNIPLYKAGNSKNTEWVASTNPRTHNVAILADAFITKNNIVNHTATGVPTGYNVYYRDGHGGWFKDPEKKIWYLKVPGPGEWQPQNIDAFANNFDLGL